ncbi:hypothetical protein BGW42_002728 [Actinomortierella wolfii]|nr:hypothetical protein BGW42_002728 [Actinomortierella wolfii]
MSGYFPPNPYPQQGYYPPPPQHQNSYPPPSQPPQVPYYHPAGGYPGQAPPSSQQYSALGSAYAPAAYPPPTAMPSYPSTVEPSKPSASPENEQPPSYPPNPYAIPETDEKEGERGMFSGYSAPPMPVAYPSGGGMVATNANINYPYPSSQPRPVNSDEMFWILYHQRYNGNEKETKEAVMQEMARLNGQFGGGLPTDPSVQICPPGPVPGSQAYPAPAQPSMYPEYSQQQPYQPAYQHEEQQPPKKDGPDWMKLAGGVAAGGLAFAGTKKLFDLMKGDKKAHEHHH